VNGDLKFLVRMRAGLAKRKKKTTMTRTEASEHTTFPTIIIITESNHGSD
jgi:hypothetical protein